MRTSDICRNDSAITSVPLLSGARPVVGHLPEFAKDAIRTFRRGIDEHGRTFALNIAGRPAVVTLDPAHRKDFFSQPEERMSIAAVYPFLRSMFGSDFTFMAPPDEYRRQRDLYMPYFHGSASQQHVSVIEEHVQDLMARMGDRGLLELSGACTALSLRIAAHAFLGRELGRLVSEDPGLFLQLTDNAHFVYPEWSRPVRTVRSRMARHRLRGITRAYLVGRRAHPRQPGDYVDALCRSRFADGRPVPVDVLVNQALGLVWSARETTAGQMAWALADLTTHPEYQDGILAEIADCDPADLADSERSPSFTRIEHFLRESERLHPMAPLLARKAGEDLTFGRYDVRRGTVIIVCPYLSHRLPEEFPHPEVFRPERYAEDPHAGRDLLLFGGGIHRCPGRQFARLEIKIALALLLRRYHLEMLDTPVPAPAQSPRGLHAPCRVRYRCR